jgi:hypothetical protein
VPSCITSKSEPVIVFRLPQSSLFHLLVWRAADVKSGGTSQIALVASAFNWCNSLRAQLQVYRLDDPP